MNTNFFALILLLVLTACAGPPAPSDRYDIVPQINETKTCRVAVKFQATLPSSAKVLKAVQSEAPGVEEDCQEDFVLSNFIHEACLVKADLVNVTEQEQPNASSACFRAKAQIVQTHSTDKPVSDAQYAKVSLDQNVNAGNQVADPIIHAPAANPDPAAKSKTKSAK